MSHVDVVAHIHRRAAGRPVVVAIGGGHGLAATLAALHAMPVFPVGVVGTADDGGSSGRLRAELGCVPPGDLRMAIGALLGGSPAGESERLLLHHRYADDDDSDRHALGNLLLTALLQTHEPVAALVRAATVLDLDGVVIPAASVGLDLVARVNFDGEQREVRGQVAIATTTGQVATVEYRPQDVDATWPVATVLDGAAAVVLGPGSWWTSVIPPVLLPSIRAGLRDSSALKVLVLNLGAQTGETSGYSAATHLETWREVFPDISLDVVIADPQHSDDLDHVRSAAAAIGAEVEFVEVASAAPSGASASHNPVLLSAAVSRVLDKHGRIVVCP